MAKRSLLPSIIEDKASLDSEMKRGAYLVELASLQVNNRENQPKRQDNTSRVEDSLYLAGYRSEKASALDMPFVGASEPRMSLPFSSVMDQIIATQEPRYEGSVRGPALSRDAIANLLRQANPNCPRAHGWLKAHEWSKAEQEKIKKRVEDRNALRKKINQNLRAKAREALGDLDIPSDHLGPEVGEDEEESKETPEERVKKAHDRLQEALFG
ncbi:hypothetical protein MW887_004248 [Aspergillus wentii]|nr:hypothetical protein MW887_004248 [Aspergillus wentii]